MAKQSKSNSGGAEFVRWFRPLIDCLHELGAAKPREVSDWIAVKERVPVAQREVLLKSGEERFHNQVQFARQYLVWEGLIDGSKWGVWSLTPLGAVTWLTDEDARKIFLKWVKFHQEARARAKGKPAADEPAKPGTEAADLVPEDQVEEMGLLNVLRGLSGDRLRAFLPASLAGV